MSSTLSAQFVSSDGNTVDDLDLAARELRSNQRILFVMLAPSDEDPGRIAEARLARRASVHLAYLTNGEGRADGRGMPYPNQLAARWRERAFGIAEMSGSGHTFLNLPFIDAASTVERVRADWPADTVRTRWEKLVQFTKPDAVILSGLEHLPQDHPMVRALLSDIASATRRAIRSGGWVPLRISMATGFRPTGKPGGSEKAKVIGEAVRSLRGVYGDLIAAEGESRILRGFEWRQDSIGSIVGADELFPQRRVPDAVRSIDSSVQAIAGKLIRLRSIPRGKRRDEYLRTVADIMQRVDLAIVQHARGNDEVSRFLLDWKLNLDRIRTILLDVRIWWQLTERILTERQLTHLNIDSIRGLDPNGRTDIHFPETRKGWIVNEQQTQSYSYVPGKEFRILASGSIPHDLPRSLDGLQRGVFQDPWYVFVVHHASTPEESFAYRIDLGFIGAPRFSAEVLTPVVRAVDEEEVVYRLTNHSRDGVGDAVFVRGDHVTSYQQRFRLFIKDASHQDTLRLKWADAPEGAYLVDLTVAGQPVANVLARRFSVAATEGRRVTYVGQTGSSALYPALRRLGYAVNIAGPADLPEQTGTILVDASIHLAGWDTPEFWARIRTATESGAHVVLLDQQASVLTGSGLFPSCRFTPTFLADTSYSLILAGENGPLTEPNDLSQETWEGWLYRVASNVIEVPPDIVTTHARIMGTESPVMFSVRLGQGTITYIDLNLTPQLANVLPAAYALLANLVERDGRNGDAQ